MVTLWGGTAGSIIMGSEVVHIGPICPIPVVTLDLYLIIIFGILMKVGPVVITIVTGVMTPFCRTMFF